MDKSLNTTVGKDRNPFGDKFGRPFNARYGGGGGGGKKRKAKRKTRTAAARLKRRRR